MLPPDHKIRVIRSIPRARAPRDPVLFCISCAMSVEIAGTKYPSPCIGSLTVKLKAVHSRGYTHLGKTLSSHLSHWGRPSWNSHLLHQNWKFRGCIFVLTFNRKPATQIIEFQPSIFPSPKGGSHVKTTDDKTNEWKTYRTRFLVRAKQLNEPLTFTDTLGREHRGEPGDYLVESSDGTTRVAPKAIFEDIYVVIPSAYQSRKSTINPEIAAARKKMHAYSATA
jgi:hypothetical protein